MTVKEQKLGGGTDLSGYAKCGSIELVYKSGECYRKKTIEGERVALNKTTKIYADAVFPLAGARVVVRGTNIKIEEE